MEIHSKIEFEKILKGYNHELTNQQSKISSPFNQRPSFKTRRPKDKKTNRKYVKKNILRDFHNPIAAGLIENALDSQLNYLMNGDNPPEKGLFVNCFTHYRFNSDDKNNLTKSKMGLVHAIGEKETGEEQHSALRHHVYFDDLLIRFQIPLVFLLNNKRRPSGSFWLYNIRFQLISSSDGEHEQLNELVGPFGKGYIGVTARHPFIRLSEHFDKYKSQSGNLIHQQWRSLDNNNIKYLMVFQIVGRVDTEDDMYEAEEHLVEAQTLSPLGFNMIPGGKNGIAFLRSNGFINADRENKDDLSALLMQSKRAMHFRSPHVREYKKDHYTFVKGAWVNKST